MEALANHIESGHLAGAGVDVFPKEPASKQERLTTRLQNLPNVILTPHIGGSTEEAQEAIARFVTNNIIEFIGVNPVMAVNPVQNKRKKESNLHHVYHRPDADFIHNKLAFQQATA